ncbi:DUF5658 family protein [Kaarinaea lacus]
MSDSFSSVKETSDFECMREVALDRRSNSWRTIYGAIFLRRRSNQRRTDDADSAHYVDVHEPRLFFVAVGALILCVADAFFTMTLLNFYGSYELNPVMDYFIKQDFEQFFFVKFGLTAFGIMFLVMHKNFRILNRISGYQILYGSLVLYAILVTYELFMLVVLPFVKYFF